MPAGVTHRRDLGTLLLYVRTIVRGFRGTLATLTTLVLVGAVLYSITPFEGVTLPMHEALYAGWMALFAQPIRSPPPTWYLELMCAIYPLFGFILVGESIVRLSLLLVSKEHGEKDWMKVTASTYRDHVVLCGLGHLGSRILDRLVTSGVPVVAMEKDVTGRFLPEAKATGAPILLCDMKDDQSLIDAGVPFARCIVIATNDDIANLEVALDARRLNPKIRILMRMFDQQIADKIRDAFAIDHAFSSAALAAPLVAAMSASAYGGAVLPSFPIGGVAHVTAEVAIGPSSPLVRRTVAEVEGAHAVRVLALLRSGSSQSPPASAAEVAAGDTLVVHTAAARVSEIMVAAGQTSATA